MRCDRRISQSLTAVASKHFLSLVDLEASELGDVLSRATELKAMHRAGQTYTPLGEQTVAVIGAGDSSVSRFLCETAVSQLGATLPPTPLNIGDAESTAAWFEVLGNMVDAFVASNVPHPVLESVAKYSRACVVNHASDRFAPCRWLADVQTFVEQRGSLKDRRIAWLGPSSPICRTYMQGTARMDYTLAVAAPAGHGPDEAMVTAAGGSVALYEDPGLAVEGADMVVCNTLAQDGSLQPDAVNADTLPQGVSDKSLVIHHHPCGSSGEPWGDNKHSRTSREAAENQLHVQKAILESLLFG